MKKLTFILAIAILAAAFVYFGISGMRRPSPLPAVFSTPPAVAPAQVAIRPLVPGTVVPPQVMEVINPEPAKMNPEVKVHDSEPANRNPEKATEPAPAQLLSTTVALNRADFSGIYVLPTGVTFANVAEVYLNGRPVDRTRCTVTGPDEIDIYDARLSSKVTALIIE